MRRHCFLCPRPVTAHDAKKALASVTALAYAFAHTAIFYVAAKGMLHAHQRHEAQPASNLQTLHYGLAACLFLSNLQASYTLLRPNRMPPIANPDDPAYRRCAKPFISAIYFAMIIMTLCYRLAVVSLNNQYTLSEHLPKKYATLLSSMMGVGFLGADMGFFCRGQNLSHCIRNRRLKKGLIDFMAAQFSCASTLLYFESFNRAGGMFCQKHPLVTTQDTAFYVNTGCSILLMNTHFSVISRYLQSIFNRNPLPAFNPNPPQPVNPTPSRLRKLIFFYCSLFFSL
jgi:hypothetical protein